jgi:hypothetical protein
MLDFIPDFPDLADLDRAHQPVLEALFRDLQPQSSELTFTNLYIWRHAQAAKITRLGENVCLFSWRPDPEDSYLLSVLGPGAGVEQVRRCLDLLGEHGHNPRLRRVDQTELDRLGITDQEFEIESDRDNWDYVYRVRDLIALEGEAYHEKAQHVRSFTRKFQPEYRPITPELVPACQELQDLWCDEKHCDLYSSLRAEARAVKQVLEHLQELQVIGGALLVNERVQAFTLGEPLNRDTVVIHIEKASPDLHGAFQAMNHEFLVREWAGWEYVNREQDVGEPGLRQAKQSYHPARMVEKFTARAR